MRRFTLLTIIFLLVLIAVAAVFQALAFLTSDGPAPAVTPFAP